MLTLVLLLVLYRDKFFLLNITFLKKKFSLLLMQLIMISLLLKLLIMKTSKQSFKQEIGDPS